MTPMPRRTVRTARTVALALTAIQLLAACGSSRLSKQVYESKLTVIGRSVQSQMSQIFADASKETVAQVVAAIRAHDRTLRQLADQLDGLNPPADAQADNDRLVQGLRDFAAGLDAFAAAAQRGDVTAVQSFDNEVRANRVPGQVEVQGALTDLMKKGYRISG
jgi:hypothetical protein